MRSKGLKFFLTLADRVNELTYVLNPDFKNDVLKFRGLLYRVEC